MPVVLAPMVEMVGLLVALGLLLLATALTIALFSFAEKSVGWIPFVGGWSASKVRNIGQAVNSYMTAAASSYAEGVAKAWATLSDALRWSVDSFVNLTEWTYRIEWYILKKHPLNQLAAYVEKLTKHKISTDAQLDDLRIRAHDAERPLAHPESGPIAAGVKIGTRPLARDFARFRARTIARLKALEHAIAVDLPFELKGTRAIAKEAERVASRLWSQVRRLDKVTTGVLATALVATAVGRLGAGWIFCRNWRKVGRSVCRLDPRLLDSLLGAAVPILLLQDLCLIARLMRDAAEAAVPALRALVVVAGAAVDCASQGAPPAMTLRTTALPVVDGLSEL
jgi:hypothetical protein